MYRIPCPTCYKTLKYGDEHVGRAAHCPKCGTPIVLTRPEGSQPVAPAVSAPPSGSGPSLPPAAPHAPDLLPRERSEFAAPSGRKYAETHTILSALGGAFSSDQLRCSYVISPDGWRVFHSAGFRGFLGTMAAMAEQQVNFLLDGQPFKPRGFEHFCFSGDSRHYAYCLQQKEGVCLVIDDRPVSACYERVGQSVLSDDATGWALAVRINKKWHVVHNGQPGAAFDRIDPDSLFISADGRSVAFVGVRARQKYVVVDGRETPLDESAGVTVSPDRSRRAWIEKITGGRRVVVDGQAEDIFDRIDETSLSFSTGGNLAYAARRQGKWHVVVDGQIGPPQIEIRPDTLTFSPDGRRMAYGACTKRSWLSGDQWRVVLDGVEQPPYTAVSGLTFSPNSARFAYAATSTKGTHIVLDGAEQGCWQDAGAIVFSPDSHRHVFRVKTRHGLHLIIDGKEGNGYGELGRIGFSPNGRHVVALAYGEKHSVSPSPRGWFLLLDNEYESKRFVGGPAPSQYNRILFDVVQLGFVAPSVVYAVSIYIDETEVSFRRIDVECG